jgi:hypothetical protein
MFSLIVILSFQITTIHSYKTNDIYTILYIFSLLYTNYTGSVCIWLIVIYLTPASSPAGTILIEREFFLAGEGSKEERGLRPLSKTSSPFQTNE